MLECLNQTSSSHTQNHLNTSLSQLLSPKIKFNFAEKFDDLKIISNFRNEKLLGLRRTKNLGFAVIEMEGDKTVRIGQISSKSLLRKVFLSFFLNFFFRFFCRSKLKIFEKNTPP